MEKDYYAEKRITVNLSLPTPPPQKRPGNGSSAHPVPNRHIRPGRDDTHRNIDTFTITIRDTDRNTAAPGLLRKSHSELGSRFVLAEERRDLLLLGVT